MMIVVEVTMNKKQVKKEMPFVYFTVAFIGAIILIVIVNNLPIKRDNLTGKKMDINDIASKTSHAVMLLSAVAIVVTIILLFICSYKLSNARELGHRKQATCGNEYLEMETARYEVFEVYKKNVASLMKAAVIMLMMAAILPFLLVTGYQMIQAFRIETKTGPKLDKVPRFSYWLLLGGSLTLVAIYAKYLLADMNPSAVSKYMKKAKKSMASTNIAIVFICMLVVCVAKMIFMSKYQLPPVGDETSYTFISTLLIVVCGVSLYWLLKDHNNLELNVGKTYYDTMNELQAAANDLKYEKEFHRYLQINIKRAHPTLDGDPDVDSLEFKDKLYAYLEHRPGKDNFDNKQGYITVKMLKGVFQPFINSAPTAMKKHDLMRALQSIYMRDGPVADHVFKFATIDNVVSTLNIKVSERALLKKKFTDAKQADPSLQGLVKATIKSKTDAFVEERALALTEAEKEDLNNIIMYIAHASDYKEDTYIPYETVLQNLDATNLVSDSNDDVLSNIKMQIAELEKNPQSTTKGVRLQKAMREARQVEPKIIEATTSFTNHVTWLSAIVVMMVLYALMHTLYEKYRDMAILLSSGTILFGVFAITWYSWFYSKLQL